ncbi:amidohydrolase family protein [Haloarchaeobius sp. TZWSO28]|uniref:amidohydrolase family protein n=1 Tax=Haloarchaeobius sp. TZWSO28 TaxID=3446119 RepID=UPI003EBD86DD
MIDSHQHIRAESLATADKRREYAEWTRREMEATGIERFTLMPYPAEDLEGTIERNKNTGKLLREHPDLGYGWVYIDPNWGAGAVEELRRAVDEDGFVGFKHHSNRFHHPLSDPVVDPLLSAANEMDVPVISHVTQRTREHREEVHPYETQTEHVREVAERYPDLTLITGHIGAGGDWERRIRNLSDLDNVYVDTSGSDCEQGQLEMAAEYVGVDRMVFGTDGWLLPGVGKLTGCDLDPEEKAEIAYKFEALVPDSVPNKLDDPEAREAAAVEHFERYEQAREETIVDANAYLGSWPYRELEGSAEALLGRMDAEGVDTALVSSLDAAHMRNVPKANHRLFDRIEGHEDRLRPVATVDPTYTKWEENLDRCVDRGAVAVKMLPLYHGYALDEEPARALIEAAAERDLPVILTSVIEDLRKQHPTHKPYGSDEMFRDRWNDDQIEAIIDLLKGTDVDMILDKGWASAGYILEQTQSRVDRHWLRNESHDGDLLFTVNGLFVYYDTQAERLAEEIGVEHLAFSAQLPFNVVESFYSYVEHLPVDDDAKDRVRSKNVLDLIE